MVNAWRWMADAGPSERAFLEAFFVWIYTARAHADGTSPDEFNARVDAFWAEIDAGL